MERRRVAFLSAVALLASRVADIGSTFYFNPTLSREANPLVHWRGLGASGLVGANAVITALLLFLLLLSSRSPSACAAGEATTLREFFCLRIYNRRLSMNEFLSAVCFGIPVPQNWLQVNRMITPPLISMITLLGFHHAFSWWALDQFAWQSYGDLRDQMRIRDYPMLEAICGMLAWPVLQITHLRSEFQQHLLANAVVAGPVILPDSLPDKDIPHST